MRRPARILLIRDDLVDHERLGLVGELDQLFRRRKVDVHAAKLARAPSCRYAELERRCLCASSHFFLQVKSKSSAPGCAICREISRTGVAGSEAGAGRAV